MMDGLPVTGPSIFTKKTFGGTTPVGSRKICGPTSQLPAVSSKNKGMGMTWYSSLWIFMDFITSWDLNDLKPHKIIKISAFSKKSAQLKKMVSGDLGGFFSTNLRFHRQDTVDQRSLVGEPSICGQPSCSSQAFEIHWVD